MPVTVPLRTAYTYDLLSAAAISARVDAALDSAMRDRLVVGAQVRVSLDGRLIYGRNLSAPAPATNTPITSESVFRLSCLSRLLVSITALALVDKDHLSLDEDIRRWLPQFSPVLDDGSATFISVRQLLSHCAGFASSLACGTAAVDYQDASIASDARLPSTLQQLCMTALHHRPGSAWGCSMASDVLGAIVAQACGGSLENALRHYVIEPLGLQSTGFAPSLLKRPGPVFVNGLPVWPAQDSMLSNADDYLRLLEALREGGAPVLSKVMTGEMAAIQTGDLPLPGWPGRGFGLGFTVLRDPAAAASPESVGTWRMASHCGHSWFVDPSRRLSGVAFTNTAGNTQDTAFAVLLRNAVYGA